MKGIVYVSQAISPFDENALRDLALQASARNEELGVTGYLYFDKGRFIQYIEGPENAVTELMDRIARDERHEVVHKVEDLVVERRFTSWHMRWLRKSELVNIGLEHLLADHLVLLKSVKMSDPLWTQMAWRMVNGIAGSRLPSLTNAS